MASRISRRISTVHQKLKKLIDKYNDLRCKILVETELPNTINWDIVAQSDEKHSADNIPGNVKRTAIDQSQLVDRCDEEVELVKMEMRNTYQFFRTIHELLMKKLEQRPENNQFNCGVATLLKSKLLFFELRLVQCYESFSSHVELLPPPLAARKYLHTPTDISTDLYFGTYYHVLLQCNYSVCL